MRLATGFGKRVPGDGLVGKIAAAFDLDVAPDGYPVPDASLRWSDSQIFVAGALAELELGPSARNLAGARLAAERIVAAAAAAAGGVS